MSRVISSGPSFVSRATTDQFLDVDRGVAVVGDDALRDQDRVLEVVAVPRHERDQHVLAERELAHVGRRAVGHHVALGDLVADLHQRTLVDVGVLVRARVLDQVVDVDADFARHGFVVVARAPRYGPRRRSRPRRRGAPAPRCPSRPPPCARCRCRPAASRRAGTAPPGAACSSPSARGSRRRARGTESARPPPTRSATAPRPCTGSCPAVDSVNSFLQRQDTSSSVSLPFLSSCGVRLRDHVTGLPRSPTGSRSHR